MPSSTPPLDKETVGLSIPKVPVPLLFGLQLVANLIFWGEGEDWNLCHPVFYSEAFFWPPALGSSTESEGA